MSSVYTVSQVNSYIRRLFSTDLLLGRVYIKGEISNCKYHSSGHIYFSLKDESSQLRCVLFSTYRSRLSVRLENGMRVVAFGQVNVYERDGSYQLYCSAVKPDGIGALYERFEALKRELSEMGMFAPEYKQKIPRYISSLGVVTAPTGAAVRDIINVSKRRNPGIRIILYPALVQGENAAESIARGIAVLDRMNLDVIIAGRGGGSMEDLWAFNEEKVARAVFECSTPLISGVGHETDTTIIDFVADLRAPTPSAAAELAVDDMLQLISDLHAYKRRFYALTKTKADSAGHILSGYRMKLKINGPEARIRDCRHTLSHISDRLDLLAQARIRIARERLKASGHEQLRHLSGRIQESKGRLNLLYGLMVRSMREKIRENRHRLELSSGILRSLSPEGRLGNGFVYIQNMDHEAIDSIGQIDEGSRVLLTFKDGEALALVEKVEGTEAERSADFLYTISREMADGKADRRNKPGEGF